MQSITNKLTKKVNVYDKIEGTNEFGEIYQEFKKIKSIYCQVLPLNNSTYSTNNEAQNLKSTLKLVARYKSIKDINDNMKIELDKQLYDLDSWRLDYKNNEFIEVFISLESRQ